MLVAVEQLLIVAEGVRERVWIILRFSSYSVDAIAKLNVISFPICHVPRFALDNIRRRLITEIIG